MRFDPFELHCRQFDAFSRWEMMGKKANPFFFFAAKKTYVLLNYVCSAADKPINRLKNGADTILKQTLVHTQSR